MPIHVKTPPEPLSPGSLQHKTPVLIASDSYRLLTQELLRYCAGEINGRSFLISGHRGAGKTTLAAGAYMSALAASKIRPQLLRPLFVPLHGPNLLPDPARAVAPRPPAPEADQKQQVNAREGSEVKNDGAAPKPELSPQDRARDDTDPEAQKALVQITLALHRAVCKEFSQHYRDSLLAQYNGRTDRDAFRQLELAAELDIELYQWPLAGRLRELWARADVLSRGVLRREGADQGLQELIALSAVCDAYRRISGTWSQTEKSSNAQTRSTELTVSVDSASKALFGPILSVLTGGLVGTGLSIAGVPQNAATFAGAASALVSALALKGSSSRSRSQARTRDDRVLFDLSVATLDRMLPMLIDALIRCGLAPMFVVDELDKVAQLETRMVGMVHHLKKFVAERAFFCFLTDRLYFEQMLQQNANVAFPPEYTSFTHLQFVVFRPADVHRYLLDKVFEAPVTPAAPANASPEAVAQVEKEQLRTDEDALDRQFLPYVVLHRARMHPIDVQREIADLRNDDGNVRLDRGALRTSNTFRFDVMIQLAVEIVMGGQVFADELARDPQLHRLAFDTMYFLSRRWPEPHKTIMLGNPEVFDEYLDERIGKDRGSLQIPEAQKKFLFERLKELARMLAAPETYERRWKACNELRISRGLPRLPTALFEGLRLPDLDPPLLTDRGDGVFEWSYDQAGNPRLPPEKGDRTGWWEEDASYVGRANQALLNLLGGRGGLGSLAAQYRILPVSPAWAEVERAISRLKRFENDEYPERAADLHNLTDYARMLYRSSASIGQALLCATAIGAVSPAAERSERIREGLRTISEGLRLHDTLDTEVEATVAALWEQLKARYHLTIADPPRALDDLIDQQAVVRLPIDDVAGQMIGGGRDTVVAAAIAPAWESAAMGVAAELEGSPPRIPDVSELICSAAQRGPAGHVSFDRGKMTVAMWSEVLADSLGDVTESETTVPTWFAPIALSVLGFGIAGARRTFTAPQPQASLFMNRGSTPAPNAFASWTLGVPAVPTFLIAKSRRPSLIDDLRATRPIAAVALTLDQLLTPSIKGYLHQLASVSSDGRFFNHLIVEMPTDVRKLESDLGGPLESLKPVHTSFLYATTPASDQPGPQIIAPKSLDDLQPPTTA